jgi:hypothetical protein
MLVVDAEYSKRPHLIGPISHQEARKTGNLLDIHHKGFEAHNALLEFHLPGQCKAIRSLYFCLFQDNKCNIPRCSLEAG